MGTSSIVYVSVPDTTSTCTNLGLPTLPTGYSYNCVTATSTKLANGNGWIPVNFNRITFGSPLSNLPVDPVNATSTRNYYTYIAGGSWELSTTLEAAKNKMGGTTDKVSSDGGNMPDLYEVGSGLTLNPIDWGDTSLVGYWNFEEGSSGGIITSTDYSGYDNNGTWNGTSTPAQRYITGKIGNYAGSFNGSGDYASVPDSAALKPSKITISMWINPTSLTSNDAILGKTTSASWNDGYAIDLYTSRALPGGYNIFFWVNSYSTEVVGANISAGEWANIVGVYDLSALKIYKNGQLVSQLSYSTPIANSSNVLSIGRMTSNTYNFNGSLDDVRIYNRAFSAAEVSALYAGAR